MAEMCIYECPKCKVDIGSRGSYSYLMYANLRCFKCKDCGDIEDIVTEYTDDKKG